MLAQHASVLLIAAALSAGCAEHLQAMKGGGAGAPIGNEFWPPPPATSVWSVEAGATTFGEAAARIERALRAAGYVDDRAYPIGVGCAHGFAVTTRIERIDADARPIRGPTRWLARYPRAPELRWLEDVRDASFDGRGRYRAFLVAFTDLPIGASDRAPIWDARTFMDGPDAPPVAFPAARRAPAGYRVAVFVYEYESRSDDGEGRFVADDDRPAGAHVAGASLWMLDGLARLE